MNNTQESLRNLQIFFLRGKTNNAIEKNKENLIFVHYLAVITLCEKATRRMKDSN